MGTSVAAARRGVRQYTRTPAAACCWPASPADRAPPLLLLLPLEAFDWHAVARSVSQPLDAAAEVRGLFERYLAAYMATYLKVPATAAAGQAQGAAPAAVRQGVAVKQPAAVKQPKREKKRVTKKRSAASAGLQSKTPSTSVTPAMVQAATVGASKGGQAKPSQVELAKMQRLLADMEPSASPGIFVAPGVELPPSQGGQLSQLVHSLMSGVGPERAWALNTLLAISSAPAVPLSLPTVQTIVRLLPAVIREWLVRANPEMPSRLPDWLLEGMPDHAGRPAHVDEALALMAGANDDTARAARAARTLANPAVWGIARVALAGDPADVTAARHAAAAATVLANCATAGGGRREAFCSNPKLLLILAAAIEVARWRLSAPEGTFAEEQDIFEACAMALCRLGGYIDLGSPEMLQNAADDKRTVSARVMEVYVRHCLDVAAPPRLQAAALRALARTTVPDAVEPNEPLAVGGYEGVEPITREENELGARYDMYFDAERTSNRPQPDSVLGRRAENNFLVVAAAAHELAGRCVELMWWAIATGQQADDGDDGGDFAAAADVLASAALLLRMLCDAGPSTAAVVAGSAAAVRVLVATLHSSCAGAKCRFNAAFALERIALNMDEDHAGGAATLRTLRGVEDDIAAAAACADESLSAPLGRVLICVAAD